MPDEHLATWATVLRQSFWPATAWQVYRRFVQTVLLYYYAVLGLYYTVVSIGCISVHDQHQESGATRQPVEVCSAVLW